MGEPAGPEHIVPGWVRAVASSRRLPTFTKPPRVGFHLLLAIAMTPLLVARSSPAGGRLLLSLASVLALVVAAVLWSVWGVRWAGARHEHTVKGSGWWFALAPLLAVSFVGVLLLDVPLRARWLIARESFDRIVAGAPEAAGPEPIELEVPATVGTYRVERAVRKGDDVFVFVESTSSPSPFLVSAGYAHLPEGPPGWPSVYSVLGGERVEYLHLDGDWYAWISYW